MFNVLQNGLILAISV